jgi:SAM-dependent methyltransferase
MGDAARELYASDDYARRHPSYHLEHAGRKASEIVDLLARDTELVDGLRGQRMPRIVEIGCGAGGVLAALRDRLEARGVHAEYRGFDVSPTAVRMARERWADIAFECADYLERNETADVIMMIDFFEHLADPTSFLRAVQPRTAHALFRIPLDASLYNIVFRKLPELRRRLGHLHFYSYRTALGCLRDCGYVVQRAEFVENFRDETNLKTLGARINYYPRALLSALSRRACARVLGGLSLVVSARGGRDQPRA